MSRTERGVLNKISLTVFPHEEDLLVMISWIQKGLKSEGPSRTHRTRVRLFTVEIASAKKSQFLATPAAELPEKSVI